MHSSVSRDSVIIIGAGVAGLAAANLLARNDLAVTIFEASNKVGGCCATTEDRAGLYASGSSESRYSIGRPLPDGRGSEVLGEPCG